MNGRISKFINKVAKQYNIPAKEIKKAYMTNPFVRKGIQDDRRKYVRSLNDQ